MNDAESDERRVGRTIVYLVWVVVMAFFFANAEIQIEGKAGWAANLPTWRIEKHWLLDVFWGGRAMTGYHAWVFPFMALVFFAPLAFNGRWRWRDAGLALVGLMTFWIVEDFAWFIVNPDYGFARFNPVDVTWHKHWIFGAPVDYWVGLGCAALILWFRHRRRVRRDDAETVL
ncbi:MAG: hypothetical protein EOO26_03790 [Comamonadaceae bacterium]|nr:MAG: hypothetical protein EOO26_03790 [Comamonadaceae bacterium]